MAIVPAAEQTKRTFCIALYNAALHAASFCPGNHEVDYDRGWFYCDGIPERRPDLTAQAERVMAAGWRVLFSDNFNTWMGFYKPPEHPESVAIPEL